MSGAGKSLITAGLCRIFRQDGYRTAPFKSQNMSLNSFITADGREMGRAQAMQAEAAGIIPEVSMNPILLKPVSNMGSQLIVGGEVRGNYSAAEYFKMKKDLVPNIMRAFHDLSGRFDVIVVEGAGSPAEINLREHDIVNMGLAEMLDAPVLLVGDIDRGGVFAQLYGTAALLEAGERERIKAFIINKFRGDEALLKPGLSMLYERCAIPVAGVVPYMDVDLDDEDSLSGRLVCGPRDAAGKGTGHVAVIRLPRISNFTDFNILERLLGDRFFYAGTPREVMEADCIIIPGTKNTMGDLKWMRQNGLEAAILRRAAKGTPVIGICGGYQMLGRQLSDPYGTEEGGTLCGMGLLPVETVFAEKKTRTRVRGRIVSPETGDNTGETWLEGYEIHMGGTVRYGGRAFCELCEEHTGIKKEDGCILENVFGSYVHGIFDTDDMQEWFLKFLTEKTGIVFQRPSGQAALSASEYKEAQYDALAGTLRESLDMEMIYGLMDAPGLQDGWNGGLS